MPLNKVKSSSASIWRAPFRTIKLAERSVFERPSPSPPRTRYLAIWSALNRLSSLAEPQRKQDIRKGAVLVSLIRNSLPYCWDGVRTARRSLLKMS